MVDIKILGDDTLDIKIDVDKWLTEQVVSSVKYHVAEACLKGLLEEMTVEGVDEPVWQDSGSDAY